MREASERLAEVSRERLQELFQRCDPNGCWTDGLGAAEGFAPPTHGDLVAFLMDEDRADFLSWVMERL